MLLVIGAFALIVALPATWVKRQLATENAVTQLTAKGGIVLHNTTPRDVRRFLSSDVVFYIDLSKSKVRDDDLVVLPYLSPASALSLEDTTVGDRGMNDVARMRVYDLCLRQSNVSDTGVKVIARISTLDALDLGGTHVSDACVADLSQITSLKILRIDGTRVTVSGANDLRQALPGCRVVWSPILLGKFE